MLKSLALVSLLATVAAVSAQSIAFSSDSSAATQQSPAPIVRSFQSPPAPQADAGTQADPGPQQGNPPYSGSSRAPMPRRSRRLENSSEQILDSQPIAGVWLRSRSTAVLKTVSATPQGAEIRLERGILNVNVHQPAMHSEILVDLPGGQTSLLKDGLYTFNADTNTVRVLHGEAATYSGGAPNAKPGKLIKIKEAHQLAFAPTPLTTNTSAGPASAPAAPSFAPLKSVEAYPYELAADLLPANHGDGDSYANISGEDGPYYGGYGYYPGYAYGPWGYGYPFGYGIGIGYYGGFGYRGGFGGYRGGGFRR